MSTNVVAYSVFGDTTVLVLDSFRHVCVSSDPSELLDFLIYSCTDRVPASALRMVWNLDKEVSCVISLLPESVQASPMVAISSPSSANARTACEGAGTYRSARRSPRSATSARSALCAWTP